MNFTENVGKHIGYAFAETDRGKGYGTWLLSGAPNRDGKAAMGSAHYSG